MVEPTVPNGGGDFGPICGLLCLGVIHGAIKKLFELILEGVYKLVVINVPDCASLILQNVILRRILVFFRVVSNKVGLGIILF